MLHTNTQANGAGAGLPQTPADRFRRRFDDGVDPLEGPRGIIGSQNHHPSRLELGNIYHSVQTPYEHPTNTNGDGRHYAPLEDYTEMRRHLPPRSPVSPSTSQAVYSTPCTDTGAHTANTSENISSYPYDHGYGYDYSYRYDHTIPNPHEASVQENGYPYSSTYDYSHPSSSYSNPYPSPPPTPPPSYTIPQHPQISAPRTATPPRKSRFPPSSILRTAHTRTPFKTSTTYNTVYSRSRNTGMHRYQDPIIIYAGERYTLLKRYQRRKWMVREIRRRREREEEEEQQGWFDGGFGGHSHDMGGGVWITEQMCPVCCMRRRW